MLLPTMAGSLPNKRCRSEEHTSELQSRVDISYAVFCLKKNELPVGGDPHRERDRRVLGDHPRAALPLRRCPSAPPVRPFHIIQFVDFLFFFNDTATTEIYTLSLHDALPISSRSRSAVSSSSSRFSACPGSAG